MKKAGPLEIFALLPQTNCGDCGEETCMAFAAKLAEHTVDLRMCAPLFAEDKYAKKRDNAVELLRPPVREVTIGVGDSAVKVGGKLVLYRHELRYSNPTPIFVDVSDKMPPEELARRVDFVKNMHYLYIGKNIHLDGVAIRSESNDPKLFAKTVSTVTGATQMPLLLCSHNPKVIAAGLDVAGNLRPLICSATKDNWQEMAELAQKHDCPLTISAPNNLAELRSLMATLENSGMENLVMDPGTALNEGMGTTIENYVMIRKAAIRSDDRYLGYPILAAPMVAWNGAESPEVAVWNEAIAASVLMTRFSDLLVTHSTEIWSYLPLMILRENLYTDPMKPVSVESGITEIGNPDKTSPVLVTTNFALTYFTVQGDLSNSKENCYILTLDTEGLSVGSALAGRKMTSDTVAEAIKETKIADKLSHKTMIIPGMTARLQGEIEELTGWTVWVGPQDSSGIVPFLQKKWSPKGPIKE